MNPLEQIGALAIEVMRARMKAESLKSRRSLQRCEHERDIFEEGPVDPEWSSKHDGIACWKKEVWGEGDLLPHRDPKDWCASCVERQKIHDQFKIAVRRKGQQQRALTRESRRHLGRAD